MVRAQTRLDIPAWGTKMTETIWTHIGIAASIVIPLGSGIGYLIWQQAQMAVKVEAMWGWWSNHANEGRNVVMKDETK